MRDSVKLFKIVAELLLSGQISGVLTDQQWI